MHLSASPINAPSRSAGCMKKGPRRADARGGVRTRESRLVSGISTPVAPAPHPKNGEKDLATLVAAIHSGSTAATSIRRIFRSRCLPKIPMPGWSLPISPEVWNGSRNRSRRPSPTTITMMRRLSHWRSGRGTGGDRGSGRRRGGRRVTSRIRSPDTQADIDVRACLDRKPPRSFVMLAGAGSGRQLRLLKRLRILPRPAGPRCGVQGRRLRGITYTEVAVAEIPPMSASRRCSMSRPSIASYGRSSAHSGPTSPPG